MKVPHPYPYRDNPFQPLDFGESLSPYSAEKSHIPWLPGSYIAPLFEDE